MTITTHAAPPVPAAEERQAPPASDSDRLVRGLPLESGEAQPGARTRLH